MTSHSCLQTKVLTKFDDATGILFYSLHALLSRCFTMCHCDEHKLSALQVRRPEQNTALNAMTDQFITAKISGNAAKQGNRTVHSQYYVSVVHNCKNTRLREQGRKEGGTIPSAPKSPNNVTNTFFNRLQYICFQKTSGSNMEAPNLLLAPAAIYPRNAPAPVPSPRRGFGGIIPQSKPKPPLN